MELAADNAFVQRYRLVYTLNPDHDPGNGIRTLPYRIRGIRDDTVDNLDMDGREAAGGVSGQVAARRHSGN